MAYTGNNPLLYVMTSSKFNATGQRSVNELAIYNLTVKYRPVVVHCDAYCLSRSPLDIGKYKSLCTEKVSHQIN